MNLAWQKPAPTGRWPALAPALRDVLLGGIPLVLFAGPAPPVAAQDEVESAGDVRHPLGWRAAPLVGPLSADRPGFSTGPQTVPRGHLQFEGGYQFTSDNEGDDAEQHAAPLLLARAGLLDNLELRLSWAGVLVTEVDDDTDTDVSDTSLGVKATVLERGGLAVGLLGEISLPTGSDDVSSDAVDPTAGLLWSYALEQGPGLFGTFLFSSLTEPGDDRFFQTAAAGGASFPLTDRLGSFIEYFGIFGEDQDPSHNADGGFTYLVNNNLQLDVNGGVGLNEDADDFFIGAGVAWRW